MCKKILIPHPKIPLWWVCLVLDGPCDPLFGVVTGAFISPNPPPALVTISFLHCYLRKAAPSISSFLSFCSPPTHTHGCAVTHQLNLDSAVAKLCLVTLLLLLLLLYFAAASAQLLSPASFLLFNSRANVDLYSHLERRKGREGKGRRGCGGFSRQCFQEEV